MSNSNRPLRGLVVGSGYFSQYQLEAWQRMPDVQIVGLCGLDLLTTETAARTWSIPNVYTSFTRALDTEKPDFVDLITPPATHLDLVRQAAERGVAIICQKPLAPTLVEATELVSVTERYNVRFMVHENFRFQPWHQELKKLLNSGLVGDTIYSIYWRMRMGDGWSADAYLARQPYFRTYERFLIYETGIHLIDTLRYLTGSDVRDLTARLHQRNSHILGEDSGFVFLQFETGAEAVLDMSRYNESAFNQPRYTFAELLLIDLNGGTLRLFADGRIEIQPLGQPATIHSYSHEAKNFAGDCVYTCQRHFIDSLLSGQLFETSGQDYLKNMAVQERIYKISHR